jgi:hypothetical protein
MKKFLFPILAACPFLLVSCATPPPPPPQAYHATDASALVIKSLDRQTSQIVQPTTTVKAQNNQVLNQANALPKRQTAVVILENYTDRQIGNDFRDRGTTWFVSLRNLGYKNIVFLQGNGASNPEGLPTLARYD